MIKLLTASLLVSTLCISCGAARNFKEVEAKRDKGEYTEVIYDYNWELVWDSMRFVMRHTEAKWLAYRTASDVDYDKTGKIITMISDFGGYDIVIWFYPIEHSKTKVQYLAWGYPNPYGEWGIEQLIEELNVYLEHGEEAFREITKQHSWHPPEKTKKP